VLSRVVFLSVETVRRFQKAYVHEEDIFQANKCIMVVLNFVFFYILFLSVMCQNFSKREFKFIHSKLILSWT